MRTFSRIPGLPFVSSLLFLSLLFTLSAWSQQVTLAPTGPVSTFSQAKDAVRAQRAAGVTGTITVTVHEGTYFLPETLVLEPEDSNTTWEAAKGEHPIVSGGRLVSGW